MKKIVPLIKITWSDDSLNEYEKANRDLIVSYEEEMGYR